MQQIKLFKGVESDIDVLERDINKWLSANGASVINIFGNIAPQTPRSGAGGPTQLAGAGGGGRSFSTSDIFLAVLYEKS